MFIHVYQCICVLTPPVNPASAMTFELSREITVRSRAAGLLQCQLGTKMSAGLVRRLSLLSPLPASHLTLMPTQPVYL